MNTVVTSCYLVSIDIVLECSSIGPDQRGSFTHTRMLEVRVRILINSLRSLMTTRAFYTTAGTTFYHTRLIVL